MKIKSKQNIVALLIIIGIGICLWVVFNNVFSIVGNTNYIEMMNTAKGSYLKFGSYEVKSFTFSDSNYVNNRRTGGCWWAADVYNNGVLLQHLGRRGTTSQYMFDTRTGSDIITLGDYKLDIGSSGTQSNGACGVYAFVSYNIDSSKISVNVLPLTDTVYTQTTTYLTVQVNNTIPEINRATLILNYDIPTSVGTFSKTISQNVSMTTGINNYQVLIPTGQVTDVIKITPSMDLYFNDALFSGLVYSVVSDSQGVNRDVYSQAVNILAGHYDGETQTITIRDLTQEQLNQANANIANLSELLANKQAILAQMQSQLALDNITANNLYNELSARQATITALSVQVGISEQQINDLNAVLLTRQNTIADLSTQLSLSNDKIAQLSVLLEQRAILIQQIGVSLDLSQQQIAQLYDLIKAGNNNAADLAQQLQIKTSEAQDALDYIAGADAQIQTLANALQVSQTQLNIITNQLDDTNQQMISLNTELKLSQSEMTATVSQLTETNKALVDLAAKYKVSQDKITELTQELANTKVNTPVVNNNWVIALIILIFVTTVIVLLAMRKK